MKPIISLFFSLIVICSFSQSKVIADYTLEMKAEISGVEGNAVSAAVKTISVSGKKVRTDYVSDKLTQSFIIDNTTGAAVILRERGDDKYIRKLSAETWKKENGRYDNISFQPESETKKILGYDCKKLSATLKDGSKMIVFYTPAISVLATENNFSFKNIPGLVLEYSLSNDKTSIHFSAVTLSFDPVPSAKFNIPVSGYRLID